MQVDHKKLRNTGETTALEPFVQGSTNPQHTNAKKLGNDDTKDWLAAACSKQQKQEAEASIATSYGQAITKREGER